MSDLRTLSIPEFTLVTGNRGKLAEAARLLGYAPQHAPLDLPEIQSLDIEVVLRAKAREAFRQLRRPLIVDETGLSLAALGGFPGPLVKWLLDSVGAAGISRIGHRLGDPGATACCALMYTDGEREIVGLGEVRGSLADTPRGQHGFGWDPVFVPEGGVRTYAEMVGEEKDGVSHRQRGWSELSKALAGKS